MGDSWRDDGCRNMRLWGIKFEGCIYISKLVLSTGL